MSGGISGYDNWKLRTPPEYEEEGERPVEHELVLEPDGAAFNKLMANLKAADAEIARLKEDLAKEKENSAIWEQQFYKIRERRDELVEELEKTELRPKVGVAVIVSRPETGEILMGVRSATSSHGANTWALPGGHLEFKEDIWDCARREVLEETGIELAEDSMVSAREFANVLYEIENRHYLTIFVRATATTDARPVLREPEKCYGWEWVDPKNPPRPLFAALGWLVKNGAL